MKYCLKCGKKLVNTVDIHGEQRQSCSSNKCDYVYYDNPVPIVAAIVERGDDIVLVRSQGWPKDWFGIVTGFLEKGEYIKDACIREVKEELGLDVNIKDFIGVYDFLKYNQILIVFHVKVLDVTQPIILETEELEEYKLVNINELQPFPGPTGQAIAKFLEKRRISKL